MNDVSARQQFSCFLIWCQLNSRIAKTYFSWKHNDLIASTHYCGNAKIYFQMTLSLPSTLSFLNNLAKVPERDVLETNKQIKTNLNWKGAHCRTAQRVSSAPFPQSSWPLHTTMGDTQVLLPHSNIPENWIDKRKFTSGNRALIAH